MGLEKIMCKTLTLTLALTLTLTHTLALTLSLTLTRTQILVAPLALGVQLVCPVRPICVAHLP